MAERIVLFYGGAAMTLKEYAVSILDTFSDERLWAFITLFTDENQRARIESDLIAHDPTAKKYSSFKEFMEEMEKA